MSNNVSQLESVRRPKKKTHKKLIIIATLISIMLVGGVSFIVITNYINLNNISHQKKSESVPPGIKIESSAKIRAQLENTTDQSKKNKSNKELITSLQLEGDLSGAIKVAIEYSNTVKTADSYGLLADLYELKGDYLSAKTYFQKALDLSEKTDLDQRSPYSYYYDKLQAYKDLK